MRYIKNKHYNSLINNDQLLKRIDHCKYNNSCNKNKFYLKNIYHIHTHYCGHSTNYVYSVVDYAIRNGYQSLYFVEHCPINTIKIFRPSKKAIKYLINEINIEQEKHKNEIKLFFGYECEYPISIHGFVKTLAESGDALFMILGIHWLGSLKKDYHWTLYDACSPDDLDEYYTMAKMGLESGYFSWIAHPDIWLTSYQKWDEHAIKLTDKLIALCESLNIPMGFNANGFMKKGNNIFAYPCEYFWKQVAKSKVKVLIEADAHDLNAMSKKNMFDTYSLAIKWGLKNNIIFNVKLKVLNKKKIGKD